ncbi:MAG TPA: hypothetical protein LFW20_06050 [Rickettsia endosymbiont of Omalisus fontisbellaquei]|nr:hypothetical protein [Rickettsia endosymbiont of Omalisus fontisbellaquei]
MKLINQKKFKQLQGELEVNEIDIERDEGNARTYFKKADVLVKMFMYTKDNKYCIEATNFYRKAIGVYWNKLLEESTKNERTKKIMRA